MSLDYCSKWCSLLIAVFLQIQLILDVCGFEANENYIGKYKPLRKRYSIIDAFLEEDVEAHQVVTEDGYILTIHHLPGPANAKPIYLQHGLQGDSISWFLLGREKSLPYVLRNAGYDVWVGNVRANTYSRKHKTLSPNDDEFWNFTWEEQGYYDIPAAINYISDLKNSSLLYIGHSMGCTTFSIMAIERPEIAKKVNAMIALGPAPIMKNVRSELFLIFYNNKENFMHYANMFGVREFLGRSFLMNFMGDTLCHIWTSFCINLIFWMDGVDHKHLNYTLIPEAFNHIPAGTSLKLFHHFLQQFKVDELRRYDYGASKNMEKYNKEIPPIYDLSKIDVPIAVIHAPNDHITVSKDAIYFYEQVPKKLGIFEVEDDVFNHFDFVIGIGAPQLVYSRILKILEDFRN